jgi:hypothetical protein
LETKVEMMRCVIRNREAAFLEAANAIDRFVVEFEAAERRGDPVLIRAASQCLVAAQDFTRLREMELLGAVEELKLYQRIHIQLP